MQDFGKTPNEENKQGVKTKVISLPTVQENSTASSQEGSLIFQYIPKSMRKKGQSPFEKVEALKDLTIPLTKIDTINLRN